MAQSRITLLVPDLPRRSEIEPYLKEIDEARWYTNFGPLCERLESGLRATFPKPYPALTTTVNGTLALELALASMHLPQGARVLIPAFTFVATASAVIRAGFNPVIADIDPSSWLLTPAIARSAMRQGRIDCVIPVAALGCPVPADEWDEFCAGTGIPVLVDAAGAFGNQMPGERIALAFSLHATKAFGIGEGGLVVSREDALIEQVRQLCNFGIDSSSGLAPFAGTNAKMSEFHAAVGLASLNRWAARRRMREALHRRYCSELIRSCPGITMQTRPSDGSYTILQVLLPTLADRDDVAYHLAIQNIETRAWYLPLLPQHPAYAGVGKCEIPVARELAPRMLGLPFHLDLSEEDISRVCTSLADAPGLNSRHPK